tara:strand:+ start:1581 stop:2465 length:885 start_codon:yes stop_codon:yes gene_type:complete
MKKWEELEHLVKLIEKSISPNSNVERDIDLPVLVSSSGRTRQCDIVIRSGVPPRETISIVEVQDRSRKVEIGDLGNWLNKLDEVGAQHLICVSHHDFPESIKEKAMLSGQKIRLMTLKEIPEDKIPFDFKYVQDYFSLKEIHNLKVDCSFKKIIFDNTHTKCWSLDKQNLISLFVLCRDFFSREKDKKEGKGTIVFNLNEGKELYFYESGEYCRVGLKCDFAWESEVHEIPPFILSYEQYGHGSLAWVVEIYCEMKTGPVHLKIHIAIAENGGYAVGPITVFKSPPMTLDFTYR